MTSSLDELLNAEFKEAFDEFDKVAKNLFKWFKFFSGIITPEAVDSTWPSENMQTLVSLEYFKLFASKVICQLLGSIQWYLVEIDVP